MNLTDPTRPNTPAHSGHGVEWFVGRWSDIEALVTHKAAAIGSPASSALVRVQRIGNMAVADAVIVSN